MSYTAPTINSSSQTWANLGSRGLSQFVANVLTSNSATQANINRTMALIHKTQVENLLARLRTTVDNYTAGRSDKASALADLLEINYAFKTVNQAIEEIGVLIDAN